MRRIDERSQRIRYLRLAYRQITTGKQGRHSLMDPMLGARVNHRSKISASAPKISLQEEASIGDCRRLLVDQGVSRNCISIFAAEIWPIRHAQDKLKCCETQEAA
ncbi:MAG: hypothetical protein WBC25_03160 [Candidatus Acidiferrum sp.]